MREKQQKSRHIRCFIGIAYVLSPGAGKLHQRLFQFASDSPISLRPVTENNLHITLKFLGAIEESQLAVVEQALKQIATRHQPMELSMKGIGSFKNSIWIGVEHSPALHSLVEELNLTFSTLGFSAAEKTYVPHITMARFKTKEIENGKLSLSKLTEDYSDCEWGSFFAPTITLYRSDTLPEGAHYSSIVDVKLQPE